MSEALVTPIGRVLYVRSLFTARRYKNDPNNAAKYGCSLVVPKNDPALAPIIAAFNADVMTVEGSVPPTYPGGLATLPYGKKSCLLDGAVRHPGDAFYADKYILGASRAEEDGQPSLLTGPGQPLMDKGELYSGADVMLHLRFYPYAGGTGGINAELIGFKKTGDNEKLGHTDPDSSEAFAAANGGAVQQVQPQYQQPVQPQYQQPVQQQPVQQQPVQQQPGVTIPLQQPVQQPGFL